MITVYYKGGGGGLAVDYEINKTKQKNWPLE